MGRAVGFCDLIKDFCVMLDGNKVWSVTIIIIL